MQGEKDNMKSKQRDKRRKDDSLKKLKSKKEKRKKHKKDCRDPRKSPRPPLHLKNGPNMPLTTRKPRGVHCFKF